MIYVIVAAACWLVFVVYWIATSFRAKRDLVRRGSVWTAAAVRIVVVLGAILLLRVPAARHLLQASHTVFWFSNPVIGITGSVLCVAGVAIAVWARTCLGANWSPRPSVKRDHELITSGPYRLVRHPIYTGMLLAALGTALDAGFVGLVVFFFVGVVLIRRIPVEEDLMLHQFPEQYLQYRRSTKALIPHLL